MALQNLIAIEERASVVAAKSASLERMHVVEDTAAASLVGWNLEKFDIYRLREESCTMVDCFNTNFAPICEQVSSKAALQSALCGAQCTASWVETL